MLILKKNIDESAKIIVKNYSDQIGLWLNERKKDIKDYADLSLIKSMDWERIELFLKKEENKYPDIYFFFFIADINGSYNTTFLKNAGNISDRDYFPKVLAGETVISDPVISKSTLRQICVIASPIKNEMGIVVGILAGTIDLEKVYSWLSDFRYNDKNSYSYIINKNGLIISHPDKKKIMTLNLAKEKIGITDKEIKKLLSQNSGSFVYNFDNIESYAYFNNIPETDGWKIITKIPKYYLFEPIYSINNKLLMIGLLGIIISIIIGFFVSASISNPIIKLTEIFRKGIDDDITARSNIERNDEIGKASIYFNKLMDKYNDVLKDLKESRNELINAKKLEAVGILAGGIAHDFNNILTSVIGMISLARLQIDDKEKLIEALEIAEESSLRAKSLTNQLLTFSKGGKPVKKISSIKELILESSKFITTGSNVKCEFIFDEMLSNVEIDEGQINQVLNNIIINAMQAMHEGGKIIISGKNEYVSKKYKLPLSEGNYIKISIKDFGAGIPKENLNKIFDPYFTTKQTGNGLGLTTSYSIIKNHAGFIKAESEINKGTTFHIYLPSTDKPSENNNNSEEEKTLKKNLRILVVDDNESILNSVQKILNANNISAEVTTDGTDAVKKYKNSILLKNKYDLVIVDLTIPGSIGGKEIITQLKELDPEVKALVSSGYSNDPVMSNFQDYGFSGIAQKPYTAKELLNAINEVLNKL